MKKPILLSWSGGKDSMMALQALTHDEHYNVVGLLTTLTEGYDRISMHGVRRALLEQQAEALGIPLHQVFIPQVCLNDDYKRIMGETLLHFKDKGITTIAHGDLFLEDVRSYREENLAKIGMNALFPLWGISTHTLARTFIHDGYKTITVCVDGNILDERYVGQLYDDAFLASLPHDVDVCGENGEFHTFVYDGPMFATPVQHTRGEIILRDNRFWYCDLVEA